MARGNLNINNTINTQYIPNSIAYQSAREREEKEIKEKLKKGLVPIRYNDYFMELGRKTYNGWCKRDVEKLK